MRYISISTGDQPEVNTGVTTKPSSRVDAFLVDCINLSVHEARGTEIVNIIEVSSGVNCYTEVHTSVDNSFYV